MFEHYTRAQTARRPINPIALAAAMSSMIAVALAAIYGAAWLMSAVGYRSTPLPVEISYDPFGDGSTLEGLIQGDAPSPIEDSATPPR